MRTLLLFTILLYACDLFAQFQVNNDAVNLGGGYYRLIQAANNQAGSVWYKIQHNLNDPLNVEGRLYFGTDDGGADGIAFVLQNNCLSAGTLGGGIGYRDLPGKSLAVEFDTYQNISGSGDQDNNDPDYDHLAILKGGNVNHASADSNLFGPVQIHPLKTNVEDGNWYDFTISYDPATTTLEVYFDNIQVVSFSYDILNNVFDGNPYVYWGFTSSTGGFNNEHQVYVNKTSTTFALSDTTICVGSVPVSLPPLVKFSGINVAVGKSAVVSSNEYGGNSGAGAVDGNLFSRWSSTFSDPQWIAIDLASIYDVDSVILVWEAAYGREYYIQVSEDNVTWNDLYHETNSDGGTDKIVASASNIRYIRMYGVQRATGYGYSLYEFEVYGSAKYRWSPDDGSIDDIYSLTPVFTPGATTTYTVSIPDPCQGTVTYDFTITVDCPAPVELISFSASPRGNNAIVNWSTSQEINNSHFILLTSSDGIQFSPLAIIKGAGTTSTHTNYNYTHANPSGTIYYKLIQVDYDGTETASQIISVRMDNPQIMVSKNVFSDYTEVRLINSAEWIHITMYDVLGRVISSRQYNQPEGVIIIGNELQTGVYLMGITTGTYAEIIKLEKLQP
ncbi:MAG TPA: discoidin domain-containing protein [Cytophagaceae bacterium]